MHISPKTIELVVAQEAGTCIRVAEPARLNAMWNEVIGLLDIRIDKNQKAEYAAHLEQMKVMSGWVRREYPEMTCESVRRAYNLAVKGELDIEKVIPRVAPIYVGAVLNAYKRYLAADVEYIRVNQQQLLAAQAPEPTEEEIDKEMEGYYRRALWMARQGKTYPDVGNGLYDWLKAKGRIDPAPDEQKAYMDRAIPEVKLLISSEKESTESTTPGGVSKRKSLGQMIEGSLVGNYSADFVFRVRAHAKYLYLNDYLKTQADAICNANSPS